MFRFTGAGTTPILPSPIGGLIMARPPGTLKGSSRRTQDWLLRVVKGVPELTPRYTKFHCMLDHYACLRANVKNLLVRLSLPLSHSRRLEPASVGNGDQEESSPLAWHHRWKSMFRVTTAKDIPQAIIFIRAAAKLSH